MTHEEYLDKILWGLNRCSSLDFSMKLLDLAIEIISDEPDEEDINRVHLLIDCYRARFLGEIDEIQGSLRLSEQLIRSLIPKDAA